MEALNSSFLKLASTSSGCTQIPSAYDQIKAAIAKIHYPTAEHSIRVRICATAIGLAWGMPGRDLTTLAISSEIHDVGKLYVPTGVLDKAGSLSDADWSIVKQHPAWGAEIALRAFPGNQDIARCVLLHHERMDGSGYPHALRAPEIPLLARIIAIADAFAALTEDRAYRAAMSKRDAIRVLMCEESAHYDLEVVEVLRISARLEQVS